MNEKRLKELLEFVKTTDLQEVVWEKKDAAIHFRRNPDAIGPQAASRHSARAPVSTAPAEPAVTAHTPIIRSTMVGTFYRSDSSERPPLVAEGTLVRAGQPVGAIEAMKIMKDVLATEPCKIVKALVANGHAVEYGQPLFEIEPSTEENV